ncbi:putative allophanate hydrolase subunit 1 [Staphylococcus piscifermentans]|uniref:Allophanate hydrolase n=1 Tax=Staphylococcus piscifermentans TaxID=70258 RepID=A0A239UDI0_9STAP|nr:5-oxoprolinase subunit PxpB [Staphylococcus piscifermentans]RTX84856.1 5-oxoprolinase subunit PxpB [Staphylococcus piscifermentans]GEP83791.1 allophanate hydrolase [Staphylococcus piscifermentans]SNV07955.1 putative allophanate hydrolase subunit 1 [Staphylococcus piscifermentans]
MKIYSQGDQAIVVSVEKEVTQNTTEDLLALRSYLVEQDYPFITEIVPTESDMMIVYDARSMIKHHHIKSPFQYMKELLQSIKIEVKHGDAVNMPTEIPVYYGGAYGPDLEALLEFYNMDKETFIQLHSQKTYFVSMMGYSPGFPYLTGMNERLYINHTGDTKKYIPAGSVILEGKKSGIVTTDTYGDWIVIGYTPVKLFDPSKEDFTLLKLGDTIRFKATEPEADKIGGEV